MAALVIDGVDHLRDAASADFRRHPVGDPGHHHRTEYRNQDDASAPRAGCQHRRGIEVQAEAADEEQVVGEGQNRFEGDSTKSTGHTHHDRQCQHGDARQRAARVLRVRCNPCRWRTLGHCHAVSRLRGTPPSYLRAPAAPCRTLPNPVAPRRCSPPCPFPTPLYPPPAT